MELRKKLEDTCKLAHTCLEEARAKYKGYHDRKSSIRKMQQGDQALILLPTDHNKMIMQWKGPFPVTARKNEVDYKLEVGGKKKLFHINMLKKYEEREETPHQPLCNAVVNKKETDEDEYDAEDYDIPMPIWIRQQGWEDVVINKNLESEKIGQVRELLRKFENIFFDVPGRTNLMTWDFHLATTRPIYMRQYPIPLAVQDVVEEEISKILELGVIEKCTSSYNAPVVIVKKKDGSNRLCVDYRRLNDATMTNVEPIPRIDVTFAKAGHGRFFSKLDVAKG